MAGGHAPTTPGLDRDSRHDDVSGDEHEDDDDLTPCERNGASIDQAFSDSRLLGACSPEVFEELSRRILNGSDDGASECSETSSVDGSDEDHASCVRGQAPLPTLMSVSTDSNDGPMSPSAHKHNDDMDKCDQWMIVTQRAFCLLSSEPKHSVMFKVTTVSLR